MACAYSQRITGRILGSLSACLRSQAGPWYIGQMMSVVVPPGAAPGGTMMIQVPAPIQAVQAMPVVAAAADDVAAICALAITLRAHPESLLESPGSLKVQWLSSRVDARLEHVQSRWREGTLTLEPDVVPRQVGEETVASQVWRLDGQGLSRTWWIEEAPPHRLLGWQTSSGESASLIASKRMAYWDAQRAQDRKLRHELGL